MWSMRFKKSAPGGQTCYLRRFAAVLLAMVTACFTAYVPSAAASENGTVDQPILATDSASFVSQTAALSTSTIRGILGDVSAEVRGPSSSYTLTIDSASGEEIERLLTGTRYNLMECYDLSLTAVDAQSITRNPQFGDVTITIPLASSMDPNKGTFAIYTIGTDGELEQLPCSVVYARTSGYAVRFMTIHFSTYAILYTAGGSTRVTGSRSRSSSSTGVTRISNEGRNTAGTDTDNTAGTGSSEVSSAASSQNSVNGSSASTAGLSSQAAVTAGSAATGSSGLSAVANGKDTNGKDANGKDPYDHPKTGDRRYYTAISLAILALGALFLIILRIGRRSA